MDEWTTAAAGSVEATQELRRRWVELHETSLRTRAPRRGQRRKPILVSCSAHLLSLVLCCCSMALWLETLNSWLKIVGWIPAAAFLLPGNTRGLVYSILWLRTMGSEISAALCQAYISEAMMTSVSCGSSQCRLCSSDGTNYTPPTTRTMFGERAFLVAGPAISPWTYPLCHQQALF